MTANQRHRPIENEQPNEKPKSEVSVGKISRVEHGILIQIASTTPDATIPVVIEETPVTTDANIPC
ncbi:hypothetical protein DAPPUDRAFT_306370 [Daphnia pulex]|uniref:Uncharacterized protein n=1 Tax=Daphnia pulex TaxID=6669 RepID=E9FY98_DAPPU|nr:hypothetical protein DAPPUDRAFT_306370 [Daphnia pulex]|eukprot:EFX87813.1 hypothetical protein DAPPUDRAFT_306370 [Daphnia pulex]